MWLKNEIPDYDNGDNDGCDCGFGKEETAERLCRVLVG
jgi:hypothetical protein